MPPKAKTTPRPTHFAELCEICGHTAGAVPADATSFACEHGAWKLDAAEKPADDTASAQA